VAAANAALPHSLSTSTTSVTIVRFDPSPASPSPSSFTVSTRRPPLEDDVNAPTTRAIVAGIKNVPSTLTTKIGNSAPSASDPTSSFVSPNPYANKTHRGRAEVSRTSRAASRGAREASSPSDRSIDRSRRHRVVIASSSIGTAIETRERDAPSLARSVARSGRARRDTEAMNAANDDG